MSTRCPFCNLDNGFHDEDVHSKIPIPADKLLPTGAYLASLVADLCKNPNCQQPYDQPGIGGCRNPSHKVPA